MIKQTALVLLPEEAADMQTVKLYFSKQEGLSIQDITGIKIRKRSIDARSRQVKIRLEVIAYIDEPFPPFTTSQRHFKNVSNSTAVHIIGSGPAGLFAALRLIESGFKPIIIERGKDVRNRRRDLAAINKSGIVDPDSNYCFGEGGAGTYSDGKLYTRSGKRESIERILETFVQFGANPEIMIDAHPHIGTNKLPAIITAIREQIIQCGGEVHFRTRLSGIKYDSSGVKSITLKSIDGSDKETSLICTALILATGHSARDVFELLQQSNIYIEAKPFALGIRIEHPQRLIDKIQYHVENRSEFLPPSSYSLVHQSGAKGVYSFCMCPGGIIAPAATSPGEIVVNGWSPSKRNNPFANSGIVVSVDDTDFRPFAKEGPLAALRFQSSIEKIAFQNGGGLLQAPAQRMIDFINKKTSSSLPDTSYIPGVQSVQLDEVLTPSITTALREGLAAFGKKMKGYLTNDAVLLGVESRTSSPVRIPRDKETLMHPQVKGLFPSAEGAGYAGGIVSAAIDGERVAEQLVHYITL